MKTPRAPRPPRAARAPRPGRPVAATASTATVPAVGSRWHMLREDGRGHVEHNGNKARQVFILTAVIEPKPGGQAWHVEYRRPSEKLSTRINLVAFLNRFTPAK